MKRGSSAAVLCAALFLLAAVTPATAATKPELGAALLYWLIAAGDYIDGFVARGDKTFPTIQSGYSTAFLGYGATDVDDSGKVAINTS